MKKITFTLFLMIGLILLVACGKPDISGTWYLEYNNKEQEIALIIDDNRVTMEMTYISYSSSFLTTKAEVKTATLLTGKVDGDKIKFTKSIKAPKEINNQFLLNLKEVGYKLTEDKKKLSLLVEDEEITFFDENPSELDSEEDYNSEE